MQQTYPDQNVGEGVGGGTTYVAGANITIVGNVISATVPPVVLLETNGLANANQSLLNLKSADGSVTLVNSGGGVDLKVVSPALRSGQNLVPGNLFASVVSSQIGRTLFVLIPGSALTPILTSNWY